MALIRSHQNVSGEPRGPDTDVCWQIVVVCFDVFFPFCYIRTTGASASVCLCLCVRAMLEGEPHIQNKEPSFPIYRTETKTNDLVHSPDTLSTDNLLRIKVLYCAFVKHYAHSTVKCLTDLSNF